MPDQPRITLIAAVGLRGELGQDGRMPWPHLKRDMAHFSSYTHEKPVVMGRKTWESLPSAYQPLPHRQNIVLTRTAGYAAAGAVVVFDMAAALAAAGAVPEICIIGGAQIYELFVEQADCLVLSEIQAEYPRADTFFPNYEKDNWEEDARRRQEFESHKDGLPSFQICVYERRR